MSSIKLVALISALASWGVGKAELINVFVGEGGLHFSHPDIKANPGDIIDFSFGNPSGFPGGNHSVTESAEFSTPCLPKDGGFNSGFVTLTQAEWEIGGIHWLLVINDTEPIWYYCAQIGHCQGGMVGSINANLSAGSNETYGDFSSLATQATTASIPSTTGGGRLVTGSVDVTGSSTTTTTTASTNTASTTSTTTASTTASTTSVSPGGSVSTTTGPTTLPTTTTGPNLPPPPSTTSASSSTQTASNAPPPPGTTSTSSTQAASNPTLSSTSAVPSIPLAAAAPAAGGAGWGLVTTGFIAAFFMQAL